MNRPLSSSPSPPSVPPRSSIDVMMHSKSRSVGINCPSGQCETILQHPEKNQRRQNNSRKENYISLRNAQNRNHQPPHRRTDDDEETVKPKKILPWSGTGKQHNSFLLSDDISASTVFSDVCSRASEGKYPAIEQQQQLGKPRRDRYKNLSLRNAKNICHQPPHKRVDDDDDTSTRSPEQQQHPEKQTSRYKKRRGDVNEAPTLFNNDRQEWLEREQVHLTIIEKELKEELHISKTRRDEEQSGNLRFSSIEQQVLTSKQTNFNITLQHQDQGTTTKKELNEEKNERHIFHLDNDGTFNGDRTFTYRDSTKSFINQVLDDIEEGLFYSDQCSDDEDNDSVSTMSSSSSSSSCSATSSSASLDSKSHNEEKDGHDDVTVKTGHYNTTVRYHCNDFIEEKEDDSDDNATPRSDDAISSSSERNYTTKSYDYMNTTIDMPNR